MGDSHAIASLHRIVKIGDRRRRLHKGEAIAVERELGLAAAGVLDTRLACFVDTVRLQHARKWFEAIVCWLPRTALEVVKWRCDDQKETSAFPGPSSRKLILPFLPRREFCKVVSSVLSDFIAR